MRILSIVPASDPGDGRFPCVAKFDAEITADIRMYGLRLLKSPDGKYLSYSPSGGGKRCATFSPGFAEAITAAATAAFNGGRAANVAS